MKKAVRFVVVLLMLATLTPAITLADGGPTGCGSLTCKP
jgi:predicted small lipoprotein YifL